MPLLKSTSSWLTYSALIGIGTLNCFRNRLALLTGTPLDVLFEDVSGYCINLVGIRTLVRVELQNVARLARIAAQLFPGEYDFLRCFVQPRILQGDLLCFFQADELGCRGDDLIVGLIHDAAQNGVDFVSPASGVAFKGEGIVGRLDAAGNQSFLGKGDFFADPGIVQCDFLRVRQKNEVVSLDDAAVLGVHLVGILLLRGVELQDVAGLA